MRNSAAVTISESESASGPPPSSEPALASAPQPLVGAGSPNSEISDIPPHLRRPFAGEVHR